MTYVSNLISYLEKQLLIFEDEPEISIELTRDEISTIIEALNSADEIVDNG